MEREVQQLFCHFSVIKGKSRVSARIVQERNRQRWSQVIKAFSYSEGENANDWRVVMVQDGEVNEIDKRNCFNKRDDLPTVLCSSLFLYFMFFFCMFVI